MTSDLTIVNREKVIKGLLLNNMRIKLE